MHHPSCRPDNRTLIYKCSQCGLEEVTDELEKTYEQLANTLDSKARLIAEINCLKTDLTNTQRDFCAARDALDKIKAERP